MRRLILTICLLLAVFSLSGIAIPNQEGGELSGSGTFHYKESQMTRDAILTSDGYYVLAGDANDRNEPSVGILIKAYASFGAVGTVWERTYAGLYARAFTSVVELDEGTFVAGGYAFYSVMAGDEDVWLVKVDADGTKIWEQTFGERDAQEDVYAMAATSDGGFIVSALKLEHRTDAIPTTWVLKFDANGKLEWDMVYDTGVALAIIQTATGNFLLSGRQGIPGSLDSYVWALKLGPKGNRIWDQVYKQLEVYVELDNGLTQTPDGNFVIAGKQFVLKIDPNGQVIWNSSAPNMFFSSVAAFPDGSLALGGGYNDDNYIDHLFVIVVSADTSKILWKNTELLPSGAAQVMIGPYGDVAVAGWVSIDVFRIDMILAKFW
jgi:hypothetical protein